MAKPFVPYVGAIVTRKHARQSGLIVYFPGKPCKHGLCAPCNLSKSDRDSASFMQEMGYLL